MSQDTTKNGVFLSLIVFFLTFLWVITNDARLESLIAFVISTSALISLIWYWNRNRPKPQVVQVIKLPNDTIQTSNQIIPHQFIKPHLTCHREQRQDTNQRKHISILRYLSPTKLLMGHYNGTIALWDKQRNSIYPATPMPAEDNSDFPMYSIAATTDGQYIAYPLPRNEIQITDFGLKKLMTLKTEDRPISMAFSPDNEWLVVGFDETGWLELWNVKEGFNRVVTYFKAHSGRVNDIQFHPTKAIFVTVSPSENIIKLWAIDNGNIVAEKEKVIEKRTVDRELSLSTAAFSPDGNLIAIGSRIGAFITWDWRTTTAPYTELRQGVRSIAFSPDGKFLAVAEGDWLRIYPIDSGSPSSIIENKKFDQIIECIAFSPDGNILSTVKFGDKHVQFCDITEG